MLNDFDLQLVESRDEEPMNTKSQLPRGNIMGVQETTVEMQSDTRHSFGRY